MKALLRGVVAAVEEEGRRLAEEFHRAEGPRGKGGSAPVDVEIEERLRGRLQALVGCAFGGEETGLTPGRDPARAEWLWLVDPQDGTSEFLSGRRGSSIAVALLRNREPVLAVVHSPLPPDRGPDTIAWAEGEPLARNGAPVQRRLDDRRLDMGEHVWTNLSSALRPATYSRAVRPARYVAMASIAYRLARVAAGDGVAAMTAHNVNEYDIAAGYALVRAAGGVLLDAAGEAIVLTGDPRHRVSACFAGARDAALALAQNDWSTLEREPRRARRVSLGFPRRRDGRLVRAAGCLLGQVIGDSLGALVEFKTAAQIAQAYPQGVRELADGGVFHTMAGQPTDDSEMAIALARSLVRQGAFNKEAVLEAYRTWLQSRPVDVGTTTERGLLGQHTAESESNGSLMRISPVGVFAAGDPARAAAIAREDSALTHPNEVCVEACAGYAAAIAAGVGGASREAMIEAALAHASGRAREAIARGAAGTPPDDFQTHMGWVLIAVQNAFYCLARDDFESGLVETVGRGGDTDTNGAIAGALLGAAHGRDAIPARWIFPVLSCRPIDEAGALRPRPMDYWPDDILELAEALLIAGS